MWQTIDVGASEQQHAEIADAIAAGDEKAAGERMYNHILALRERLEKLQKTSPNALRHRNPQ
jgi:DNA-binding GntR family transcriptional regulator